jgi:hypothetical protein
MKLPEKSDHYKMQRFDITTLVLISFVLAANRHYCECDMPTNAPIPDTNAAETPPPSKAPVLAPIDLVPTTAAPVTPLTV